MGKLKSAITLASTAILLTGFLSVAHAFHEGGAIYCEGCHRLHGPQTPSQPLLHGADVSSTCLRCHAQTGKSYNILSHDGSSFSAGGDFYWLERSYSWNEAGRLQTSPGESHGHNVVASEFGMRADGRLGVAPGGDYPVSGLTCISCHDPHAPLLERPDDGSASTRPGSGETTSPIQNARPSYRMLGGKGYASSGTAFEHAAPVAVAPVDWNETDTNHVAYGSGMSEWCANCHQDMLGGYAGKHPAGAAALFSQWTAEAYGSYIRTGDFTGISSASYLALIPFERGAFDSSSLDPTNTAGPDADSSNVMCLSCHRAHATAFRSIGRWDFSASFLVDSHPGPYDGEADALNAYHGRDIVSEFGDQQRSLCNKCHVTD